MLGRRCARLVRVSEVEADLHEDRHCEDGSEFLVKQFVLTRELRSCMKAPGTVQLRREVTFADM